MKLLFVFTLTVVVTVASAASFGVDISGATLRVARWKSRNSTEVLTRPPNNALPPTLEAAAELLKQQEEDASSITVVLATPSHFDDEAKSSAVHRMEQLGVTVARVMPAPAAACSAFLADGGEEHSTGHASLLVVGHLETCVVDSDEGVLEIKSSADTVEGALRDAALSRSAVGAVLVVAERDSPRALWARDLFPDSEAQWGLLEHPADAAAVGAAASAALASGEDPLEEPSCILDDLVPLTLGVRLESGLVFPVLARNERIPASASLLITPLLAGASSVAVYEGERPQAEHCLLVVELPVPGVSGPYRLRMSVDASNVLSVNLTGTDAQGEPAVSSVQVAPEQRTQETRALEEDIKSAEEHAAEDYPVRMGLQAIAYAIKSINARADADAEVEFGKSCDAA